MKALAAALAALLVAIPAAAGERTPKPAIEAARGGQCVAPADEMRRNHMKLLIHQRGETVRLGIRDSRTSLNGCIECHASRASHSVAARQEDFCVSCHSYAAVKIDCFECHSASAK